MATFAKAGFNAVSYAAFRPTYPQAVFKTVLAYHRGPSDLLLDLGCGHGLISRELSPSFKTILGTDPSSSMIAQAKSSSNNFSNVQWSVASAEDLSFVEDGSLDMVVAGQAAHWFDYKKAWPELGRKMRKGGTLAFWGYVDNKFVGYPKASTILLDYCYGPENMGPHWEQPGRNIHRNLLKDVKPPETEWEDVQRIEYDQVKGLGDRLMWRKVKLGEMEGYARTFSCFHNWAAGHTEHRARKDGGKGDIIDWMMDDMLEAEPEWGNQGESWRDFEVEIEWGSYILLARRK